MAADPWVIFDVFQAQLGNELHDLHATDVIKMALMLSTWTPDSEVDLTFSVEDAHEHANANGYTSGGVVVAATFTITAGVLTLDVADGVWNAVGGPIVARYACLWNSSAGGTNDLMTYCLMDNTPADVTANAGTPLTVAPHASGVYINEQTT